MQLIRRSKNYLIKVLTNLLRSLNEKPNNKGDTIYALPYKSNINKIEEKDNYDKNISVQNNNNTNTNTIRIVSSYIKSIKIKKK